MLFCLKRIAAVVSQPDLKQPDFVALLEKASDTLDPATLYPSGRGEKACGAHRFHSISEEARETINLLVEQLVLFICIASPANKGPLNSLCQSVMFACVQFQEVCAEENDFTEKEKRLEAQNLADALENLDRLVNDCLLREFLVIFNELDDRPLQQIREAKLLPSNAAQSLVDEKIKRFDDVLDRLIQIGLLSIAYCRNAKIRSNLQSCLSSCEALGLDLIPAILSQSGSRATQLLERHWDDSVKMFRHCVHEIINTSAFCSIVVDSVDESLRRIDRHFDKDELRRALSQCDVFSEHARINEQVIGQRDSPRLQLHFDDFRMMITECKASLRTNIDPSRVRKRFAILSSTLKSIGKAIDAIFYESNATCDTKAAAVTVLGSFERAARDAPAKTDSMNVLIDVEEFVSKKLSDKLPNTSILYESFRRPGRASSTSGAFERDRKEFNNPKRVSKRKPHRTTY